MHTTWEDQFKDKDWWKRRLVLYKYFADKQSDALTDIAIQHVQQHRNTNSTGWRQMQLRRANAMSVFDSVELKVDHIDNTTNVFSRENYEYDNLLNKYVIDRTDAGALQRVLAALKPLVNIMIGTKAVPLPYQPINSGVFLRKETYEMATKETVVEELTTKL
jgi:hypothetical protein